MNYGSKGMGKPGSRGVGQIKVKCHANKELRLAPQFHRGSLKDPRQKINSRQCSLASSLIHVLIRSILGLPNAQEDKSSFSETSGDISQY